MAICVGDGVAVRVGVAVARGDAVGEGVFVRVGDGDGNSVAVVEGSIESVAVLVLSDWLVQVSVDWEGITLVGLVSIAVSFASFSGKERTITPRVAMTTRIRIPDARANNKRWSSLLDGGGGAGISHRVGSFGRRDDKGSARTPSSSSF